MGVDIGWGKTTTPKTTHEREHKKTSVSLTPTYRTEELNTTVYRGHPAAQPIYFKYVLFM